MDRQHLMKMAMLALAVVALVYVTSLCSRKKVERFEDMEVDFDNHDDSGNGEAEDNGEDSSDGFQNEVDGEGHEDEQVNEHFNSGNGNQVTGMTNDHGASYESVAQEGDGSRPADCFPKDQLTPGELLPGDANSKWSESVPTGQGELSDQNFLTAGYHVGVNTVGQTLRNANRQIRSEPPNPQVKVSPWLQTTIETDTNRRPLEIGGCE